MHYLAVKHSCGTMPGIDATPRPLRTFETMELGSFFAKHAPVSKLRMEHKPLTSLLSAVSIL